MVSTNPTSAQARKSSPRLRLFIPAILITALLTWVSIQTGRELSTLRTEIASTSPERYTMGRQLQSRIEDLNENLLFIQLTDLEEERIRFQSQIRQLSNTIHQFKRDLPATQDQAILQDFVSAFQSYLTKTSSYQGRGLKGIRKWTTVQLKEDLEAKSAPLIQIAAQLAQRQTLAWNAVSNRLQHTLEGMGILWRFSLAALIASLLALAWATYKSWIAPLQSELDQSRLLLERQEKLASLGTLAAGVAHEIRNPLTAMKLRLFSLEKQLARSSVTTPIEDISILKGELHRLDNIVKGVLQFARPAEPRLQQIEISVVFQQVRHLLGEELAKKNIELTLDPGSATHAIADLPQLTQVLINLIHNAADSISPPGSITVRAQSGKVVGSESFTTLEVIDTGAGIPPEVQRRMFDPFFSTKPAGTGLGLAIALRIIEKQRGMMDFTSQPGVGTTFRIHLPSPPNF